jgi:hypothetical protein
MVFFLVTIALFFAVETEPNPRPMPRSLWRKNRIAANS